MVGRTETVVSAVELGERFVKEGRLRAEVAGALR